MFPTDPGHSSHLPRGVRLRGTLSSTQDIRIDASVEGDIQAPEHCVIIGLEGRVRGSVFARDLTIEGEMCGRVTAVEIVDLRERARFVGEMVTPGVIVADGAWVQGRIETKRADAAVRVARYRMERREHV